MKITKTDLKTIVKECLVEILNEGLVGSLQETAKFSSNFDKKQSLVKKTMPTPQLNEAVRRESGGNKVLETILKDTAESTLPKMLKGEVKGHAQTAPGGLAEQVVAASQPEELFGDEIASKWADLAFSGHVKK